MKIEPQVDDFEDDLDQRGINLPATMSKKPSLSRRNNHNNNSTKMHEPLDFEKIFLIGFNENSCLDKEPSDQNFLNSLKLTQEELA